MVKMNDRQGRIHFTLLLIALVVLLLVSAVVAVSVGQVAVPFGDSMRILGHRLFGLQVHGLEDALQGPSADIIWLIRLPRVLMAMLVGAGLAMCGCVMQASVQNPLADPYILGISSGAALGATFSILIGFGAGSLMSQMGVAASAFLGALLAALAVMTLSSVGGKMSSVKLILAGTVINALCSAFSNFIIFLASDAEGIRSVTFWMMGSIASAKWDRLPTVAGVVIPGALFLLTQSRVLNTMLLGDEAAVTLGINLNAYRRLYMAVASVVTGVIVSACGIIGFVGLIIPHLVRGLVGSDHRRLMPASILVSAVFLVLADLIARSILGGSELPIGIVTALFGAPMFMYMLVKKSYGFGG